MGLGSNPPPLPKLEKPLGEEADLNLHTSPVFLSPLRHAAIVTIVGPEMNANLARGWILGYLVACLGASTAGCSSDSDEGSAPPPSPELQRGTMAVSREDACNVEPWGALDVHESLGILLSVFPGGHKRGTDCILAAHNCQEAEACTAFFLADDDQYDEELEQLPKCGSERTDHCEGTVAKYCVQDGSGPLHEASFDCALAGATCFEWQTESGDRWANCQAPQLQCEGPGMSYCDGTRAVVCEQSGGTLSPFSPWVFDCADAWGSHCVDKDRKGEISCEGPVVGETKCDDGKDGDSDGKVDCDDEDCRCESRCDDGIDNDNDGRVDCDDGDCNCD